MGESLIQQKRGKGSPRYRAPSFRYKGKADFTGYEGGKVISASVGDIVHSSGHSAPLMELKYSNGETSLLQAPEGIKVGDKIEIGKDVEIKTGNILPLKSIPEGTSIYNIESMPGDGGKFVRAGGAFAKVAAKLKDKVLVILPSKKEREFSPGCRASIGIIAGSGRTEKPFLKAGKKFYAKRAKNKFWPSVSGTSMNAVDHPFGGRSSCRHK